MQKARRALWLLLVLMMSGEGAAQPVDIPSAVGRISYGDTLVTGAAICTGVLVAPDLVLTAAHCVRGLRTIRPASASRPGGGTGIRRSRGGVPRWFCPYRRICTRMLHWSCWTTPLRPRWPCHCCSPHPPRRHMRCMVSGATTRVTLHPRRPATRWLRVMACWGWTVLSSRVTQGLHFFSAQSGAGRLWPPWWRPLQRGLSALGRS